MVFRINECDERKGARVKLLNKLILENAKLADKIIFISHWLKTLFLSEDRSLAGKSLVIPNGADSRIFNPQGYKKWNKKDPLKIVTHHWGAGLHKGFDIYLLLDKLLAREFKNQILFTFIGNIPRQIRFKNTKIIAPQSGKKLAQLIKENHIYLTASQNEPAGMHHIEGALCGLPLLYRQSGALPEYCQGFGLAFQGPSDFSLKLEEMMEKYNYFVPKMKEYTKTGEKMSQDYYNLFLGLIKNKNEIIKRRELNLKKYLLFHFFLTKLNWLKEKTRIYSGVLKG